MIGEPTIWANWRGENGLGPMKKAIEVSDSFLLLLLPLPGLVILKPVEHILPFDVTIRPQPSSYLLYLLSSWCPYSLLVQVLQHAYLLLRRVPP